MAIIHNFTLLAGGVCTGPQLPPPVPVEVESCADWNTRGILRSQTTAFVEFEPETVEALRSSSGSCARVPQRIRSHTANSANSIVMMVFSVLGIVLCIITAALTFLRRSTVLVQAMHEVFAYSHLFGLTLL